MHPLSRFFVTLAAALCGAISCTPALPPPPADAALIRARLAEPRGAKVFALRCASCHGEMGNGPGAPPVMGPGALARFATEHDLEVFIARGMPPRDPVDGRKARAVSRYLARVAAKRR